MAQQQPPLLFGTNGVPPVQMNMQSNGNVPNIMNVGNQNMQQGGGVPNINMMQQPPQRLFDSVKPMTINLPGAGNAAAVLPPTSSFAPQPINVNAQQQGAFNIPPAGAPQPMQVNVPPAGGVQPMNINMPPAAGGVQPMNINMPPAGTPQQMNINMPVNVQPASLPQPMKINLPPTGGVQPMQVNMPPARMPPMNINMPPAGAVNVPPAEGVQPMQVNMPPAAAPQPMNINMPPPTGGVQPMQVNMPPARMPPMNINMPPAGMPPTTVNIPKPAVVQPMNINMPPAGGAPGATPIKPVTVTLPTATTATTNVPPVGGAQPVNIAVPLPANINNPPTGGAPGMTPIKPVTVTLPTATTATTTATTNVPPLGGAQPVNINVSQSVKPINIQMPTPAGQTTIKPMAPINPINTNNPINNPPLPVGVTKVDQKPPVKVQMKIHTVENNVQQKDVKKQVENVKKVDEPKKQVNNGPKQSNMTLDDLGTGAKFKKSVATYLQDVGIIGEDKVPEILFDSSAERIWTQRLVQEKMYNKTNVTIVFKSNNDVYCIYLSKIDGKSTDDEWMKDPKYALYVLFRKGEQKNTKWVRKDSGDDDDVTFAYGLFDISNTNSEIVQAYSAFTIERNKKITWESDFLDYYETDDGSDNTNDIFDKIATKKGQEVSDLLVMYWK